VRSGGDRLVLYEEGQGGTDCHFGFKVDSPSKGDQWKDWLMKGDVPIFEDVTEDKYRNVKFQNPTVRFPSKNKWCSMALGTNPHRSVGAMLLVSYRASFDQHATEVAREADGRTRDRGRGYDCGGGRQRTSPRE
jgi:hypothetical protein